MNPSIHPPARSRLPLAEFDWRSRPIGEKQILDYHIAEASDGTAWGLSILVVRGSRDGPTFLVNGGTHGDEYEGPVAIQELFETLNPAELRGIWLGIPVLNEPAMSVPQRCGKYDHQDLARVFPGKPEGTLSEQIAYHFSQHVLKQANYYLDLHSGGTIFRMVLLAGYSVVNDLAVLEQQRKMAIAFGAALVWGTPSLPGRTLSQAERFGIPAIYAETTGTGGLRREDVAHFKEGTLNVMRSVGMLNGSFPTQPCRYFREVSDIDSQEGHLQIDHPSPCKGLFIPQVELWDRVRENQEVGRIIDSGGRILSTVRARRDGHVILIRHGLSVADQDPLLVVVENLEEK